MRYEITLTNSEGVVIEETMDLPVADTVTWEEFEQVAEVKELLLTNPSMRIIDITPEGMPRLFTDGEATLIQLRHMGLRQKVTDKGQLAYENIDEDCDDSNISS